VRAQRGYQAGLGNNPPRIDADASVEAVKEEWAKRRTANPKLPELDQQRQYMLGNIAAHVERGNATMPTGQAVQIAIDAVNPDLPIRFKPDAVDREAATVQIGQNPPVRMGADAINQIALARGGSLRGTPQGVPTQRITTPRTRQTANGDAAHQALPGVTGNPTARPTTAMNPVEDARKREAARRAVDDVGVDYSRALYPDMNGHVYRR
jgi:hypothetical protein